MAINFPSNPTNGQTFYDSTSGNRYYFDSTESRWVYAANNQPFPIASDKQVLFNNAGGLDGTPGLTFDTSSNTTFVNDLNVANNITGVNSVFFDTSATGAKGTVATGELTWNPDDYTLDLGVNTAIMQIGQEIYYRVKNQTGSMIPNGTVVMAAGTLGASGRILVAPAIADGSYPSKYVMGITTQDIPNGGDGFVTSFGKIRGLDTSMWSAGDILYANPAVAGGLSNTMPLAPNTKTTVAIVVNKHANNGELFIRPTYGSKLNEDELIELAGLANGDILAYVTANGRFENKPYDTYLPNTSNAVFVGDLRVKGNVYVGSNTVTITNDSISLETLIATNIVVNGSAIPSGAISNLAFDTANSGYNLANNVYASVNSAFGVINAAYTSSNADYALTNAVFNQSNTDNVRLSAAYVALNAAFTVANASFAAANAEYTFTNTVYAAVNSAFGVINASYTSSNADYTLTNAAYTSANANYVVTNSAFAVANAAYGNANSISVSANNYAGAMVNAANSYAASRYVLKTGDTVTGNLSVVGSLTVSGNTFVIDGQTLRVSDPLIYLAGNNYSSDIVDIGFIGNYVNTGGANVHTGLYREHVDKEWYLFQGYDAEPINNHIGALSNNMTLAVLNAHVRTSNLNLGGANAIIWIKSAYDTVNAAYTSSNADYVLTNAAFNSVNSVAIAANNYAGAMANSGNAWATATFATITNATAAFAAANAEFTFSNTIYAAVNSAFAVINAAYTSANANYVVTNAAFGRANTALQNTTGTFAGSLTTTGSITANTDLIVRPFNGTTEGGQIQLIGAGSNPTWFIDSWTTNLRHFNGGVGVQTVSFFNSLGGANVVNMTVDGTATINGMNITPTIAASYTVANAAFGTANAKVASVSGTSGRITSSGGTAPTIDLATAGAGAATYSSGVSSITVDAYGRVTSVTGSAGYVTSSGVTSVAAGTGLSGGTITSTGTISMPNVGPGAGSYSSGISALTLDAQGRVTAITGSAGYITASGSITGSAYSGFVQDTRNTVTGPSTGSRTVRWDFVANATDGLSDGGLYHGVMTFQQWVDASGGGTRQLGFTDNDNLWIRGSGTGVTSYNSWKLLLNSSNYNSYAPTLTGTGASGTWGISISGSAAQAGGFTPSQTSGAANRIVVASANGYILNNYFFSTDDVSGGTLTYLMGKFGDNYYRSATAAKVAAFISGQSMNINGSATSAASATTASQLNGVSHTEIPNGNNGSGVQWATVSNMSTNHKTGWYSYNNPTNAPTATYHTWMNVSGHVNNDQYGWQLSGPYWGDALYYRKKEAGAGTENWKTWRQVVLAGVSVADIIQSDASVRGPIFYDSNDTARYVDPNGTSVLNDVRGNIFYQRDDTNNRWDVGYLVLRSASPTIYFRDTDHNSAMLHNNSNLLYVLRGGNDTEGWAQVNGQWPVVINLTNNDMTIGGSFAAIGNVTAYASDRRLKENIKEIPNAIEKIRAIRGVTFDWNEISEQNGFTPSRKYGDIGCIAQEVEAVLPQVVTLAPFDVWIQDPDCEYTEEEIAAKTGTSKSGKNYLTVQYERIVPLLIQAIKEQQEQIDELKRRFENN